jgi:hypothetical protein
MPNVYASEAECGKTLGILERLIARLYEVVEQMGGPASLPATGGWMQFAEAAKGPIVAAIAVVSDDEIDTQVGEEASSSESSDDDAIDDGDEPGTVCTTSQHRRGYEGLMGRTRGERWPATTAGR